MVYRVLLIASDADDATAIEEILVGYDGDTFIVDREARLSRGLLVLQRFKVDAIILSLYLPDSFGIETFDTVFAAYQRVPIIILAGSADDVILNLAVQRGAQGCFARGHFDGQLLPQSLINIIKRRAVEEVFFIERSRAEVTLNSISDAVIGTDLSAEVDYLNVAAEALTGWSREEARGIPVDQVMKLIDGATRQPTRNPIELVLKEGKPMGMKAGTILVQRDGKEVTIEDSASPIHDSSGKATGAVIVFHDVTVSHAMAVKMMHMAQHDVLTDLPNRSLLNDRLDQAIAWADRHHSRIAVFFLDIDGFKSVNDSIGHSAADKVLQNIALRLSHSIRRTDTVSRYGGDEFVILTSEISGAEDTALIAQKVLDSLSEPHSIGGQDIRVSASIGIGIYPVDGNSADAILKCADVAMYQAKKNGKNRYQFFNKDIANRADIRRAIQSDLIVALKRMEFTVHYQPKINLDSYLITGSEALLRWIHPKHGLTPPDQFIPVAEDCGLIEPIGRWVLREACAQAKRWLDAGLRPGTIAVNISAIEFLREGFVEGVRAVLLESRLEPSRLQLEITEGVLMRSADISVVILGQLKAMGVKLAVDDFGTGYSSLSYLTQFPIDVLKIDRSFVRGIATDRRNEIVIESIIALGNSLDLTVVAEGIESERQLRFLRSRHCEEGQGYAFSEPVIAGQYVSLLEGGSLFGPARSDLGSIS